MIIMYKLALLCCLLVLSVLADRFGLESRYRLPRPRLPRGCANRVTGWLACARANSTDVLTPHPFDCHLFYYCGTGAPACRRCPAGLHFNAVLLVCDWPGSAGCSARPPPPPPPTPPCPHNATTPAYTTEATSPGNPTDDGTTSDPVTMTTDDLTTTDSESTTTDIVPTWSSANSDQPGSTTSDWTATIAWPSEVSSSMDTT